jgi:hypothetical protein
MRAAAAKIADRVLAAYNARQTDRHAQADREDRELRSLMAAASGGSLDTAVRGRPMSEVTGGNTAPITGRFDSALTTVDNRQHWSPADGLAADAAGNAGIRYTLRNRARYEVANNCYCRGVGESIATDFVGTGPRLHIDDERLSPDERAEVERKFWTWTQAINLPGKLKTMRKARRQDGEAFACKITNPNLPGPVKLDLRLIEADQVRFVDIQLLLVPSVDGIRFDDYGNPVSYHILRVHPGYWSYATGYIGLPWEYDVWDARYVIHWFRQDRPGQHRGLPEFLPALPLYASLRRTTQAVIDALETAADFAVLLETQAGAMALDDDGAEMSVVTNEVVPGETMALQRRMITALPQGYKASQMQAAHPNQEYGPFKREVCGEIGRCENVTLNVVLGDSSQSNMASGQLDHKIYFRPREIEREEANRLILENLFRDWVAEGVRAREGNGDYGKPYLPAVMRQADIEHSWYWDSNELGDPLKLAAARSTDLANGVTTIPAIYESKGQNWIRAFKAAARSLGLVDGPEGTAVEQYQELLRNKMFATRGVEPVDAAADESGSTAVPEPGKGGVKKPGQRALKKATAEAAA